MSATDRHRVGTPSLSAPVRSNRLAASHRRIVRPLILARRSIGARLAMTSSIPRRYRAETRFAQLDETLRLVDYSAATHFAVAFAFLIMFWSTDQRVYIQCLFAAVGTLALVAMVAARVWRPMLASERSVDWGLRLAAGLSFMMGVAWATMPIALFTHSSADQRLVAMSAAAGLIADVYVLGPTIIVGAMYVTPIVVGTYIGLNLDGEPVGILLSVLLTFYALFVAFSSKGLHGLSVRRIVDGLKISEQSDTIGMLLRDFEENTVDWLWEIDRTACFHQVSDRVAHAVSVSADHLQDAPFSTLIEGQSGSLSAGARAALAAIAERRPFHDQMVEIDKPTGAIVLKLTGKPIFDKAARFTGYRGVGSDVTASRNAEARIAYMATHDELTGLANRTNFVEAAHACRKAAAGSGRSCVLLYLDLDDFKTVNDSHGHAAGDTLLRLVAERLRQSVPADGIISRLGGDEFAVFFAESETQTPEMAAQHVIDEISVPYDLDGLSVIIGVSIGIAVTPRDADRPEDLLVKADLALYRAKTEGRGRFRMFVERYEASLIERRSLESDLQVAMALGEFALHYQPLVDLVDGRIVCFETLIRWHSEKRGPVSPVQFIPIAESIGLIVPIGQWVLRRACQTAATWPTDVNVAINISPQHFRRPDFVRDVIVALETSGLAPTRLDIEITEGVFLDNSETAVANLHALRQRGVRIALDDFGTGFSSLNYLANFPVDKIKIDRSFITNFVTRHENRVIVQAILALAKELSIRVTAEGVETMEQAAALRLRQCDEIQGFLVSEARPADELGVLLRERNPVCAISAVRR